MRRFAGKRPPDAAVGTLALCALVACVPPVAVAPYEGSVLSRPAVAPDSVRVFFGEADVPGRFERVAFLSIHSRWSGSDFRRVLKGKAGQIGANGVILFPTFEPGAARMAVAAIVPGFAERSSGALAIYLVPADSAGTTARGCPRGPTPSAAGAELPADTTGAAGGRARPRDDTVRDPEVALREICAMMARSATAWNRGDLDDFVADYLDGEGTTYIGSRGIVRGPAAIRAVYAPRFAPGGVRDSLSFERVEVDLLAPDLANTVAWYVLTRGDSVTARGPTSLVMRRVRGQWKIVHDHSS